MRRPLPLTALILAFVVLSFAVAACGGDDDEGTTTTTPAPTVEAPNGGAPPSGLGALPPGFVECMAGRGYEIESSADIHSAPPEVLQACFGAAH